MSYLVNILKSLSDETRLRIINLLYEKELCVCDIIQSLNLSQAKASRHLIYLKNSGLVKDRKCAQWVYYSIIRDINTKFIDILVYDTLRNLDIYTNDIMSLNNWLKQKNINCDI